MNVIREAVERLPGHWFKGSQSDGNGNYCGIGHVGQVLRMNESIDEFFSLLEHPEFNRASNILNEVAKEQYPDRSYWAFDGQHYFASFNDHPDTTEAEVIAVMEKAAVRLDELV